MKTFYKSENIFIMLDGLELPMFIRFWDDGVSPSFGPITLDYAEHLIEKCTPGSPDDWNAAIDRYLSETKKYVDKFRVAAKPQCTCKNIGQAENCDIQCDNGDDEPEPTVSEQWYLCDEDLRMECSSIVVSFRKGGKYKLIDRISNKEIVLLNEYGSEHRIEAWLKHFTLITNDLRFEIERGIEPAEVEFNQNL